MPVTLDQYAAALKKKFPQWRDIPDDRLVQAVLTKFPQFKEQISGAAPKPPRGPEMHGTREDFTSRMIDRLGGNIRGTVEMPAAISEEARRRFLELHPENAKQSTLQRLRDFPGNIPDLIRSGFGAAYSGGLAPAAKGLYSVTGPGIAGRELQGEDPANLTADALMAFTPGGEEAGQGTHVAIDRTKAGPLRGAMTRGVDLMNKVDAAAKDIPVNWQPAYEWAKKAQALTQYGWTLPAPIKAFIDMIDSRTAGGGLQQIGPKDFIERPRSVQPFTYQDARNFETSLGERIDWDPGNKMNGIMKQMRKAVGTETAAAIKPYGLDTPYLRAKAEFTKAYGAEAKWGPFGYFGGKLAGYGVGAVTGHPLFTGYAGGKLGQSAAGQLVRSITRAGEGEPGLEEATRRPSGGLPPLDRLRMATDRLNLLKQRLAQNPGDYHAVSELRNAEDTVAQASREVWPERYKQAPKTVGAQGGGGANYTADQLVEFKKKWGIK